MFSPPLSVSLTKPECDYRFEYRANARQLPVSLSLFTSIDADTGARTQQHERDIDIRQTTRIVLTFQFLHMPLVLTAVRTLATPEYEQLGNISIAWIVQCNFRNQVDLGQIYCSKPLATLQMTFAVRHAKNKFPSLFCSFDWHHWFRLDHFLC